MNRKLHNTAFALTIAGTALVLCLVVSAPAGKAPVAVATATVALAAAEPVVDANRTHVVRNAVARRIRRSVAMPFFSFVARG